MKTTYIYGLVDPRTQQIRYVGKTCDPHGRMNGHLGDARRIPNGSAVMRWVLEVLQADLTPEMVLLEDAGDNWPEAEDRWIVTLRAQGFDLVNTRRGGIVSGPLPAPERPPLRWWSPTEGFIPTDPTPTPEER